MSAFGELYPQFSAAVDHRGQHERQHEAEQRNRQEDVSEKMGKLKLPKIDRKIDRFEKMEKNCELSFGWATLITWFLTKLL
jgi:hypothetical protein